MVGDEGELFSLYWTVADYLYLSRYFSLYSKNTTTGAINSRQPSRSNYRWSKM